MANSEKQSSKHEAKLVEQLAELRKDSTFAYIFDYFEKYKEEGVKEVHDSLSILKNCGWYITPDMLNTYPDSPTVQRCTKAFKMFTVGNNMLRMYHKQNVETQEDCEYLRLAFHNYALAEMCENFLFERFRPPDSASDLVDRYLRLRPNDVLAEYFKIIMILRPRLERNPSDKYVDFELQKLMIRTGEEFVLKIEAQAMLTTEKRILTDLLYKLGSIYSITDQPFRSLHSFKKSYDIDHTNMSSLYAIAYNYLRLGKHLDEAETLLLKFIEEVPACDRQYPNAYYCLAKLYLTRDIDLGKAAIFYQLGEKAEENAIPFLKYSHDLPQKSFVKLLLNITDKFDTSQLMDVKKC